MPNSVSGGYVFEGRLTVTKVEDGVKKSEFYYFNVGFDKNTKSREMERLFNSWKPQLEWEYLVLFPELFII
jgi:hypothetical protein